MSQISMHTKKKEDIHCVIVQLSSVEKTLMSLMALKAVKILYPNLRLNLIVRDECAPLLEKVEWIEHIAPLPIDEVVDSVLNKTMTEKNSLGTIARWVAPFIDQPWDFVIDWTYSDASSYLCSLIPGYRKIGYYRSSELMLSCSDDWSHYIQAVVQGGIVQDIHLTDILTTQFLTALQIHYGPPVGGEEQDSISKKDFFNLKLTKLEISSFDRTSQKKWVTLHLSEKQKWDTEQWVELSQYILQRHPRWGVLLSSDDASKDAVKKVYEKLMEQSADQGRIKKVFGKITFDYWMYCLSQSEAIVCFDAITQQMASLLGIRVIALSSHQKTEFQNAAYGNQNYVIEAHNIDPRIVYTVFALGFNYKEFAERKAELISFLGKMNWENSLHGVNLYSSHIRTVENGGGVYYYNILDKNFQLEQWMAKLNGQLARSWYCGWTPPIENEFEREMLSPALLQELRKLRPLIDEAQNLVNQAYDLSGIVAKKTAKLNVNGIMSAEDKAEIVDFGKKLTLIDQRLSEIAEICLPVKVLNHISRVMMHNLRGQTLNEISQESVKAYARLKEGARLIESWVDYSFLLSRPKAIGSQTEQKI